jgi:hypothetical protein
MQNPALQCTNDLDVPQSHVIYLLNNDAEIRRVGDKLENWTEAGRTLAQKKSESQQLFRTPFTNESERLARVEFIQDARLAILDSPTDVSEIVEDELARWEASPDAIYPSDELLFNAYQEASEAIYHATECITANIVESLRGSGSVRNCREAVHQANHRVIAVMAYNRESMWKLIKQAVDGLQPDAVHVTTREIGACLTSARDKVVRGTLDENAACTKCYKLASSKLRTVTKELRDYIASAISTSSPVHP